MKVKTSLAKVGQIVNQDVFSMTNQPIVNKNTVLNTEHLSVLTRFHIEEIDVLPSSGFSTNSIMENESTVATKEETFLQINKEENLSFPTLYLQTVKRYKQLFTNWQSGSPLDMLEVRQAVLKVLEEGSNFPRDILLLHHYATSTDYINHHAISVGILSTFLAKKLHYSNGDCMQIGLAGVLSDCGMAKVQPTLLKKSGALSPAEFDEVKQHTIHGYNMLKKIPSIKEGVLLGVLQHHEREDGSGYPLKVQGSKLHPFSKILAVADVYLAMTAERPYRSKQSPFKVLEMIMKDQFGKFDHQVIRALFSGLSTFSTGSRVKLSNQEVGEIVFIEESQPTRPIVKLDSNGEFIALKTRNDLYIEELLS
ncbi:HD-GYP domain-containing protein [Fictibacillus phosphorivorans]|uniref:HD-GYP domain-containing protein n=1 Tax=Fictibacillus phosphorivorans TaxID=1221500 RepID=UPI0020403D7E|nr:HD-GYP domain-containing protein [Fictibacillus phosphorivorans]MCM3720107.1 HD-GYP domain-containing protein [Fictibacillus phosphorivorans]MCM3777829.1 HD-GYP domain-containing protein [Fictibacillus phosphorivorans]